MSGIFLIKGMQLRLKNLRIPIGSHEGQEPSVEFHIAYDACLAWARIALKHREDALAARSAREIAWTGNDDLLKGKTLEEEFTYSLQAVVSSATAIDALYAQVSDRYPVSRDVKDAWAKNRTARSTQICETFRTTFGIGAKSTKLLGEYLIALFRIRDAALHPTGKHQPAVFHSEISIATEWRFWTFRASVADNITCLMSKLLWDLAHFQSKRPLAHSQFMMDFRKAIGDLFPNGPPKPIADQVNFWLP